MKDYFGQELKVGDVVVYGSRSYAELITARITQITAKNIRVQQFSMPSSEYGSRLIHPLSALRVEFSASDMKEVEFFGSKYLVPIKGGIWKALADFSLKPYNEHEYLSITSLYSLFKV